MEEQRQKPGSIIEKRTDKLENVSARRRRIRRGGDRSFGVINAILMSVVCITILYPLYYVLVASVTDPVVAASGKLLLYPEGWQLRGYQAILGAQMLWIGYANTIKYTFWGTLISLVCTIPAGYALSRRDLPGRSILLFLFTFTMFFSGGMIPTFLLVRALGMYNTIYAMIFPTALSVYNLIVCRSFFENTIEKELLDAAKIDGCSDFGCFFRIALPLSSAIVAVMALFYATSIWGQYFNALLYLQDDMKMPLQYVLQLLLRMAPDLKYCAVVLTAFPMLLAYPFFQKYIAKGVYIGAVKG